MQLTLHTDYAIRTLVYLGLHPDRVVPVSEIAQAHGISTHHLAKVGQMLVQEGWVSARRGREGGLSLSPRTLELRLGALVRRSENHDLLECFDRKTSQCALTGFCRVERALREAREAFFAALDRYTLADLVSNRPQLLQLIARGGRSAAAQR